MSLLALTLLAAEAKPRPAEPPLSPWAEIAGDDLEFIHDAIAEHHPGPVDSQNPAFAAWHQEGYERIASRLPEVTTWDAYMALLREYVAGFQDGHVSLQLSVQPVAYRWPTVMMRRDRAAKYVVAISHDEKVGTGDRLLSCDGRDPESMIDELMRWRSGPHDIEAARAKAAAYLFLDDHNPWRALPKECTFARGESQYVWEVWWGRLGASYLEGKVNQATFGRAPDLGAHSFGNDGMWVAIPAFSFDEEDEAAFRRLVSDAPTWRDRSVIVLDVRGNTGGNSAYGTELARALWGDAAVAHIDDADESYVEWRVSPENVAHLEAVVHRFEESFGADSEATQYFSRTAVEMKQALGTNQELIGRPTSQRGPAPQHSGAEEFHPSVYLLTDGRCASACLDFADLVLALPGTTHIGHPTSADSLYMDVRSVPLPSGVGELAVPIKVYRNRKRGHNQDYQPQIRYPGTDWNDAALEAWVTAEVWTRSKEP